MSTASTEYARQQDVKTDKQTGSGGGMLSSAFTVSFYTIQNAGPWDDTNHILGGFLAQLNLFGSTQVHSQVCFHGDS